MLCVTANPLFADGFDATPGFGGPDATDVSVTNDRRILDAIFFQDSLKDYKAWKKELAADTGLSFSVDYTAVSLWADESLDSDTAAGGIARFYGSWDLVNKGEANSGALIWKVEHRHDYGDPPPSAFAIGHLGYVGLQEPPFSNQEFRTTNLYWRQRFSQGKTVITAGFLDATDYLDVYALASPWLHFFNFAFSTGSASMALPNDANLGIALGSLLTENIYVIAALNDTNSDPTDIFQGFDTFFDDREYFKSIEVGWTTSHQRLVLDNYHVTLWHKDQQEAANVPDGWGVNFSFTRYVNDKFLPFLRGGWTEDGGSLLEKSLSAGLGYQPNAKGSLLGAALNWGEPNADTFGPGLDDQYALEVFYRFNLTPNLVVTADLQYLRDSALNPQEDSIWLFGLRGRVVF